MSGLQVQPLSADVAFREDTLPAWRSLLDASARPTLFLTPEWVGAACRHLGGTAEPWLLAVNEGERLVGLAPLWVRTTQTGGLDLRVLEVVGTGSPSWADDVDIVAASGREDAVGQAVARHLLDRRRQWDLARLTDVAGDSPAVAALTRVLHDAGLPYASEPGSVCPYLDLDQPWTVYEERAHRRFRDLGKYLKRLAATGAEFGRVETPAMLDRAVGALVELSTRRVESKDSVTSLVNADFQRFVGDVCAGALGQGWLRLYYIAAGAEFVALNLNFAYAGRVYGYLSGFDPEWQRHGVGTCLFWYAIRDSWQQGMRVYDFLRGDEAYKYRWTESERRTESVRVVNRRTRYAVARVVNDAERVVRRLWRTARRVMPPVGATS